VLLFTEATNRKRPLQALSTLEEDATSLMMSAIDEAAEAEQPTSKSARHSNAAGTVARVHMYQLTGQVWLAH
jgi:hypothetical protein